MPNLKTVSIRDVDQDIYLQFKVKCLEQNCSVGTAISEAMELWNRSKGENKCLSQETQLGNVEN